MEIVEENDKLIHAKYENCDIFINFSDFLGIRKKYRNFQFDDGKITYLSSFECDMQKGKKGNGRILLSYLLEYIKNTRFKSEDIFISLLAVGKNHYDETAGEIPNNDEKLIQYYTKLGFTLISKDIYIMVGRLSIVLSKCRSLGGKRTSKKKKTINEIKKRSIYKKYVYYS